MAPVPPQPVQLNCPACSTPFRAGIYTLVDVSQDTDLKLALLGGQLNVAVCPNCGTPTRLAAPMVYHDAGKQLCLVYFPQEQSMRPEDQERFVGEATSFITRSLPPGAPRAYLLAPRRFLTLPSLLEAILEAEGPGRKALERQLSQRLHLSLLQVLANLLANDEEQFAAMLQYQREALTPEFFEDVDAFIASLPPELEDSRELLLRVQARLKDLPAEEQVALDEAELSDAIQRLIDAPEDQLPQVVAELRPYLEYEFFELLTGQIESAAQAGDQGRAAALTARRDRILQLSEEFDRQLQAAFEAGNALLSEVIDAPDPVAALRERGDRVNEDLMTVLSLHKGAAQSMGQGNLETLLDQLEVAAIEIMQERLTPEQRFISELLMAETPQESTKLLRKNVAKINPALVKQLNEQADHEEKRGNKPVADRLRQLARESGAMLF